MGQGQGGGPKPQPAHLHLIRGNPSKRAIKDEPQPASGPLPAPPDYLSALGREEWLRVAQELYYLGLLTTVDVNSLAAYCQAFGRWITAELALAEMAKRDPLTAGLMIKTTNGNAMQNPLVGTAHKAASDMVRYACEFGLTPAARARLAVGPTPQKSKFDGLLA